jgi:hypothetical protein
MRWHATRSPTVSGTGKEWIEEGGWEIVTLPHRSKEPSLSSYAGLKTTLLLSVESASILRAGFG